MIFLKEVGLVSLTFFTTFAERIIMVRKYLTALLCVCALWSCTNDKRCVIEGTLPDSSYDDEMIYLTPFMGMTADRIDSARIENGVFRFEKEVETSGIYVLRMRPLLRLSLQELLVVVEPGRVHAQIGSVSSAKGTRLNDDLQQWKDRKEKENRAMGEMRRDSRLGKDTTGWRQRMTQLQEESLDYNIRFVESHKQDVLGKLVYSLIQSALTPEQKQSLAMPE